MYCEAFNTKLGDESRKGPDGACKGVQACGMIPKY